MQIELSDLIQNPYHLFLYRKNQNISSTGSPEDLEFARQAFLFVVANYRGDLAHQSNKALKLKWIDDWHCLEDTVSEDEILEAFTFYCKSEQEKNNYISIGELVWAQHFLSSSGALVVERLIFRSLLHYQGCDQYRKSYSWRISEADRRCLALEEINSGALSANQESRIAYEFGLPDPYRLEQFCNFLRRGELDLAKRLDVRYSTAELVRGVITEKCALTKLEEAFKIAQEFLPEDADLIEEIQRGIRLIPLSDR